MSVSGLGGALAGAPAVAFAGTPDFAVPCLELLASLGAPPALVLTQPDRPAGRGRVLKAPPVAAAARGLGLRVAQPQSLAEPSLADTWGPAPDVLVVVAYGLLLPAWLLGWPRLGCVNVHASLLPRWRGAAPIQHAILAGDPETGVSLMHIVRGLDRGPVYARRATPIGRDETAGELHDRLARLGAALLGDELPRILEGRLVAEAQDEARATYAPKIEKQHARIDWREPAAALECRVRAFNPWPVAEGQLSDGRRLRVLEAHALDAAAPATPGTILACGPDGIDVAAGRGVLRIARLQPPSSRVMDAQAYLAAHSLDGVSFVG
jgi:methionyl-tRNA formyltransferase